MAKKDTFFSKIKTQIIAGVGVGLTALGTLFIDVVKEKLGLEDEETTTEETNGVSQSVNVTGPEIIINIPEQKTDTVVKKVYVKSKPKLSETEKRKEKIDW